MKTVRITAMMLFVMVCLAGSLQQAQAEDNGPSAWPEWTCETFPGTIDDAVAYYETNGGPATLDADGDGLACNEADTDSISSWDAYGVNCASFGGDQAAAQNWFTNHGQPWDMDLNDNGVACENESDGDFTVHPSAGNEAPADPDHGPSAWPNWSCHTFPDGWNAAIDYYHANGGPASLDADDDGIPCEPNGDDEVTECRDLGGPQQIAQDYYDANGQPRNLDLTDDGLACMNEADGYWGDTPVRPASLPNDDDEAASDTSDDVSGAAEESDNETPASDGTSGAGSPSDAPERGTVLTLPSTGAGPGTGTGTPFAVLLAGTVLALVAVAATLRSARRAA